MTIRCDEPECTDTATRHWSTYARGVLVARRHTCQDHETRAMPRQDHGNPRTKREHPSDREIAELRQRATDLGDQVVALTHAIVIKHGIDEGMRLVARAGLSLAQREHLGAVEGTIESEGWKCAVAVSSHIEAEKFKEIQTMIDRMKRMPRHG